MVLFYIRFPTKRLDEAVMNVGSDVIGIAYVALLSSLGCILNP